MRVCLFVCVERVHATSFSTWLRAARWRHQAARQVGETLPLPSSPANKSAAKSDYDQERFVGTIQKKYKAEGTLKQKTPRAVRLERGNREPCLHITFLFGGKQLRRLSRGISSKPSTARGKCANNRKQPKGKLEAGGRKVAGPYCRYSQTATLKKEI